MLDEIYSFFTTGNTKALKEKYYLAYAIIFSILCFILVLCLNGNTFISENDGILQHYTAFVYYGKYLRKIAHTIFINHSLSIPEWDFSLGEGSDILTTLHYYVIGEPINILSAFAPEKYAYVLYDFLIIFRLFFAGISFSVYCFERELKSRFGILAGSIVFTFSFYAIFYSTRHPFFLTPMIYLPMVLTGIEKILRNKSIKHYVLSVFLIVISNFYFAYIIALLTVIYILVRIFPDYRQNFKVLLKIIYTSLLGIFMGSATLLPIIYVFFNDARNYVQDNTGPLYSKSYYLKLLESFSSTDWDYSLIMGYSSIVLISVFFLFIQKNKYVKEKVLLVCSILISCIPFFGSLFNGFSYPSNRWVFAQLFLCSYITAQTVPVLVSFQKKDTKKVLLILLVYSSIASICYVNELYLINILMAIVFLCFLLIGIKNKIKFECGLLLFLSVGVSLYMFSYLIIDGYNTILADKNFIVQATQESDAMAVSSLLNDDTLSRYASSNPDINAEVYAGISSISYYWSLSNSYMADVLSELEIVDPVFLHYNYDSRTSLLALSSVLYYVVPDDDESFVPYGYEFSDNIYGYDVYENEYVLPLAYVYSNAVSEDEISEYSAVEKAEIMLQNVVLEETAETSDDFLITSNEIEITDIICEDGIEIERNSIYVTKEGSSITILFVGNANSETYLSIHGFSYAGYSQQVDVIIDDNKTVTYYSYGCFYSGKDDFSINAGYSLAPMTSVKFTFSDTGTYSFDSFSVICQDMKSYGSYIDELKLVDTNDITIDTNKVTLSVNLSEEKWICFSIPYSSGWVAYIDGVKTELELANYQYMALQVSEGEHTIVLSYHTPLRKAGLFLSVLSLVIFLFIQKRERKSLSFLVFFCLSKLPKNIRCNRICVNSVYSFFKKTLRYIRIVYCLTALHRDKQ